MLRTPVYFFSHGGPNVMYEKGHPVYAKLTEVGKEITEEVRPRALVVFSAHWQALEMSTIEVNTDEMADLIYDFYGFPLHYYKEKYPNVGSKKIASKVIDALESHNVSAKPVSRGLDHGVWASFKVAFNPETNPLKIPIVQVSLFRSEDSQQHQLLGEAIRDLRSQNIQIIVSGMAVHNLRDHFAMGDHSQVLPYTFSFDEALKTAVESRPAERQKRMAELLERHDARQAHPTLEHLLPIYVGAGAAGEDRGKQLWTFREGATSWAQYRFGDVEHSKQVQ